MDKTFWKSCRNYNYMDISNKAYDVEPDKNKINLIYEESKSVSFELNFSPVNLCGY